MARTDSYFGKNDPCMFLVDICIFWQPIVILGIWSYNTYLRLNQGYLGQLMVISGNDQCMFLVDVWIFGQPMVIMGKLAKWAFKALPLQVLEGHFLLVLLSAASILVKIRQREHLAANKINNKRCQQTGKAIIWNNGIPSQSAILPQVC